MDFYEKERMYESLRNKIRAHRKSVTNLKASAKVMAVVFIFLLAVVLYMNNIIEIENVFTKISTYVLLTLFISLISLRFLIKKKEYTIKVIDGKINVLINIG